MLWLQSSISTVAQELWYSHWWTCRSEYSRSIGTLTPSRRTAENSVSLISRFSVSPNSYCFDDPEDSMPVARSRVSCRPKLDLPSEPSRSFSVLKPRKSSDLSVTSNRAWPSPSLSRAGLSIPHLQSRYGLRRPASAPGFPAADPAARATSPPAFPASAASGRRGKAARFRAPPEWPASDLRAYCEFHSENCM